MIDVTIINDSSMEDVLGFKCCNLPDQNMEIHVRNIGDRPITIPGFIALENSTERKRLTHVYPPWERSLSPGETGAFYCHMEPAIWNRFDTLIIQDGEGKDYRFPVRKI